MKRQLGAESLGDARLRPGTSSRAPFLPRSSPDFTLNPRHSAPGQGFQGISMCPGESCASAPSYQTVPLSDCPAVRLSGSKSTRRLLHQHSPEFMLNHLQQHPGQQNRGVDACRSDPQTPAVPPPLQREKLSNPAADQLKPQEHLNNLSHRAQVVQPAQGDRGSAANSSPDPYARVRAQLLGSYRDVFPDELPAGLPPSREVDHKIELVPG